jgi:hypothetical protein
MTVSPIERRYVRRENPPPFRITPRVLAILDALRRYGLLTSQQIARLDGGSHQKVLRLLQLLFDHRLVDRPGTAQLSPLSSFFDARPLCYSLSRKGAHVLAKAGVEIDTRLDRTTRNKRAVLIEHTISVAETMFAFHAACATQGGVRISDHHDLLPFSSRARSAGRSHCASTCTRLTFPNCGAYLENRSRSASRTIASSRLPCRTIPAGHLASSWIVAQNA